MAVPDEYTVPVTIESATPAQRGNEDRWSLKIKVPFSHYPITTFISRGSAQADDLVHGSTHMVALTRGNKIKPESDGERAWHWYWDVAAWDTSAPATPVTEHNNGSQDEYRRSKVEMRWTEALGLAVGQLGDANEKLIERARWFYSQLEAGPPDVAGDAPEGLPEEFTRPPPGSEDRCATHNIPFGNTSKKSGRRYHAQGSYTCVEGIGIVHPDTGEPVTVVKGGTRE